MILMGLSSASPPVPDVSGMVVAVLSLGAVDNAGHYGAQADVGWSSPDRNVDGSAIGTSIAFNVYQGVPGNMRQVGSNIVGNQELLQVTPGQFQCWYVQAVNTAGYYLSALSKGACIVVPTAFPMAPTNLTVN